MDLPSPRRSALVLAVATFALVAVSCARQATDGAYFGRTEPPAQNHLRYVTGDEPESLDPQIVTAQPDQRICMALYEGLVEYEPQTLEPIPAIAERWDINHDSSEFVFHLRQNARWSNGEPITAADFVYSFRRAVSPEVASRNAYLAYYVKNAQAYNERAVFVRDPQTNEYLAVSPPSPAATGASSLKPDNQSPIQTVPDTPFHQLMSAPARLTLPGDEKARSKLLQKNPTLQAAVTGKEFVNVQAQDIGVEAVDEHTVRISLRQSAPFFVGVLANPFFRLVPRKTIEAYGEKWSDPSHIVTCGPFKVKAWEPYDELVVERDPMYWDTANVRLDEIYFYPLADNTTTMNLYKVGEVDAVTNHAVPGPWLDVVRPKKDYMDGAEASIIYILINTTKAPMNDLRVRKAFDAAIDKQTWATWRKIVKPLTAFTPEKIFADYPQPHGGDFDPVRARQLLGEAGFPVTQVADGSYECRNFPVDEIEYLFNTRSSNKVMAEFMQAQWKQNLGITVRLRNMEGKTFLAARAKLDYKGFAFGGFGADYMDPFTFLNLFYPSGGDNGTGWWDQKYADMLDEANRTLDKQKRYELLARAEKYLLDSQPIIPIETPAVNWVKKPYVKGMYANPASLYPWKFVYLERDRNKW
jgi:ABC-type oligopeptide transport system substrate-binding subunit